MIKGWLGDQRRAASLALAIVAHWGKDYRTAHSYPDEMLETAKKFLAYIEARDDDDN